MEKKYTKGPWSWKVKVGYYGDKEYRLSPILNTDTTEGTPWGDSVDIANAHLIAAAPDLLDALEWFFDRFSEYEDAGPYGESYQSPEFCEKIKAARAAIRKAYGRE